MTMLQVRNLRCFYGRIMAVKGVSLSVREGELISLIGANGAGKSTLLEAICGLSPRWKGEIRFEGESLEKLDPPSIVRRGIGLVPEGRLLFPPMSVIDNLRLGAYVRYRKGRGREVAEDLERIMDLFPILRERAAQPAGTLSGGEQQMLAIGRALMARPRLLVLDEPSMGLAPLLVERILDTLRRLREEGLTVLLVEQNARAALAIADRGYVMETGKIVLQGRADELLADEEVKRAYLGKDYDAFTEGKG
jgi:branched-chain amino acid transport system ATP-binding protein